MANYFNEQRVSQLLTEYQKSHDDTIFTQIQPEILAVINGMINKHFIHNKAIYMNRDDAISFVYIEILRSLSNFNPQRGRAYAYINMIAKRSLISFYNKHSRITNKEMTYTDLTKNIDDTENGFDIDNIVDMNVDYSAENDNELFDNTQSITGYKRKGTIPVDESLIIIYKYLQNIQQCFSFFRNDDIALNHLINDIDYDVNACFCFANISSQKKKKFLTYYNIISNIDILIQKILIYIKNRFDIDETRTITNYDGNLSNRAISYIRTSVDKYMNKEDNCLADYFNTSELIAFINYVINYRVERFVYNG